MEKFFCHFQIVDGVETSCEPPRVFTITKEKRKMFDEWATLRAGVVIIDEITGDIATVFKASCGLGCECAASFQLHG
jgi:hypothetical protein